MTTPGRDPNADIGNPKVNYIRSTDPSVADSLLVGAFAGSLIAIVREDLDHTVKCGSTIRRPPSIQPSCDQEDHFGQRAEQRPHGGYESNQVRLFQWRRNAL
ncbi:MAG: hypothetical protein R2788_02885 [Saprospiraceae bacterium]